MGSEGGIMSCGIEERPGGKGPGGRFSISVKTWSTVFEEPEHEEEYSVSEYFGSFTVSTPTLTRKAVVINDDFDVYSEVTFEKKLPENNYKKPPPSSKTSSRR